MGNALNLQEVDQEQALNLSKFFIRSGQNIFLFGRRGTGKTHIALQAAEKCKFKVNYINLSVIERPDLAGYPNMNTDGDVVTFKSPAFLPRLEEGSKPNSIILFDEVDKAPPEVTAPLLEILQFKKVNGVPINVAACILTGNLINEGAYSNLISTALLDRGAKYILSFNFEKWIDWSKANNVHDLILGFLRSHPDLACGKLEDSCYASPSPRAWTLASEALIKARELKIVDIESVIQIISGYVGSEAGLKFKIWYEHYRKFEPFIHSLIETGNTTLIFNDLLPTEKIVFVISACYYAKHKLFTESVKSRNRLVYLEHLCKFLQQYKVEHEVQVMGFYNSFDFDMIAKHKLYECKMFFDHFNKLTEDVTFKK
jgi:AAA domain (dynein-related subfamily)